MTDLNVGALFLLAFGSLGVYGIILGGYASANRYSLLGGLRSAAQVVSYEIVLGLSLVGIFLLSSSLSIRDIMEQQSHKLVFPLGGLTLTLPNWYILSQPLAFVIFFIAAVAETNRAPFDLPEAETELVSGFHTEYSAFRFSVLLPRRVHQHDRRLALRGDDVSGRNRRARRGSLLGVGHPLVLAEGRFCSSSSTSGCAPPCPVSATTS